MDPERIGNFLNFLREAERACKDAQHDEKEAENQLQDIEHRLEFHDDTYYDTARLAKLIRQVRRKRRVAKEVYELYSPAVDWAAKNKATIKELERLLGTLRHIKEVQGKRQYCNRTNILDDFQK